MENKKPDNVSDNPGLLPYGSNIGAPSIRPDDISGWKSRGVNRVNSDFKARYEELREEYKKLIEEFKWNDLIYHAQYTFEPVTGNIYHLYRGNRDEIFLSIINPNEWNKEYIGSFQLDSKDKWTKIEYGINK